MAVTRPHGIFGNSLVPLRLVPGRCDLGSRRLEWVLSVYRISENALGDEDRTNLFSAKIEYAFHVLAHPPSGEEIAHCPQWNRIAQHIVH